MAISDVMSGTKSPNQVRWNVSSQALAPQVLSFLLSAMPTVQRSSSDSGQLTLMGDCKQRAKKVVS